MNFNIWTAEISVAFKMIVFFCFCFFIHTAGNRHKQNSQPRKETREDKSRFRWRRAHKDASQGTHTSKIETISFTARIPQNQRMPRCGERLHDQKHVQFTPAYEVQPSQNQSSHEKHDKNCDTLTPPSRS